MNAPKVTKSKKLFKATLLPLSPSRVSQHYGVFCVAKYRGAVQKTEGLNVQTKILSYLFTPPKKPPFLRSLPVVPDATPYP